MLHILICSVMEKSEVAASRPEESPTIITDNIIPDFFHNDLAPRASPIESKALFYDQGNISHHFSFSSTQKWCTIFETFFVYIFFWRPRMRRPLLCL
jgi:hypothetical protein